MGGNCRKDIKTTNVGKKVENQEQTTAWKMNVEELRIYMVENKTGVEVGVKQGA